MVNRSALICDQLRIALRGGGPRLPAGSEILWRCFIDLSDARTYHASGPNPIGHADIGAYLSRSPWPLNDGHVSILRDMDRTFLRHHADRHVGNEVKRLPPRSEQAMTSALFDAMF
jgi:hypothetical protein